MKYAALEKLITTHSAKSIVDTLEPYILTQRREKINQVISGRLKSIQIAIEAPADINNAFAAIRTAEALGISDVHLIAPEGTAVSAKTVTQGAVYWVNLHFYDTLSAFLHHCQQNTLTLAGGVMGATQPLADVPIDKPLCLMVGNEQRGLTEAAKTACDYHYTIPMVGMSESMNLSVSAAISLYDTSTRKRQLLNQPGDLTGTEAMTTRAKYYLNSVSERLAVQLFSDYL